MACTCRVFLTHPSRLLAGRLGCFRVLVTVNSAAVNTVVRVSFQANFSPDVCPGVRLQITWYCIFSLLRKLHTGLQSGCTSVHTWWAHFKAEPTQHIITPLYFMLLTNLHGIITSPKTDGIQLASADPVVSVSWSPAGPLSRV